MTGKGQEHSKFQQGIVRRYYENIDAITLQKLGEIVSDLYLEAGGRATKLWESARTALARIAPGDERAAKVISLRSVTGLAKLVNDLNADAKAARGGTSVLKSGVKDAVIGNAPSSSPPPPSSPAATPPANTAPGATPTPSTPHASPPATSSAISPTSDQLKAAMRAFRKRLKLTKLDDESRLGRNPMSTGKASSIAAIMAPREYPQTVWEELVKQGKLKSAGGSFYELGDGA